MTFSYLEEDYHMHTSLAKRAGKQGPKSATRRMLAEQALEIDVD
jgi:hypothetical protein